MLKIGRRPGESIQIGDSIIVCIRRISGGRVTVGIDAPKDIRVRRIDRSSTDEVQPREE